MQEQGPRTPSPTPEVSAGEEKIFSSENENPSSQIPDRHSKSACRHPDSLDSNSPTPTPFRGYPGTHYKNRSGLRDNPIAGTQDPSPAIPEQFPLDANFQKP